MRLIMIAGMLSITACATQSGEDLGDIFAPPSAATVRKVEATAAAHPLGSQHNPVRADMPAGERAYLERLRCSDGNAPAFERGGSVGEGPYGKIMDVYELKCLTGQPATAQVYIDMYHDHVEDRPVPGFTIKPRS